MEKRRRRPMFRDGRMGLCILQWTRWICFETCTLFSKLKLKLSHYTPRRCLGESRYSSYSFSTSALDGGEWSASSPGRALAPVSWPPIPIVQEAGWAPEPVWTETLEKNPFASAGIQPRSPGRPARHYTHFFSKIYFNIILPSTSSVLFFRYSD
jgi:hypothetical protein